jgi:membrane carboxypeptidase/penicillin-binding protein
VLGAQPVRPIDLAAFYAAIANEGLRLTPHIVESIERNGATVYRHDPKSSVTIKSVDTAAFYQLKTMMQGVLARLAENDLKPWRKDVWCISQVDAEYVREGAPRQHRASFALCALMRQIRSFDILTKAQ